MRSIPCAFDKRRRDRIRPFMKVSVLLPFCLLPFAAEAQQAVVIEHATLIDGSGGAPLQDAALLLEGGRIVRIAPTGRIETPAGAETIDAAGKTVIPGMINLHGHVGLTKGLAQAQEYYTRANVIENLGVYAAYGVTTTTSMGTDLDLVAGIRDEIDDGSLTGIARVVPALQGFTVRNGYPTHAPGVKGLAQEVTSAQDARKRVDMLAGKGARVVKMWVDDHHGTFDKLTPDLYGAIIDQAHKRGLIAAAHLYELADAKGLVDAGLDAIVHSVRDKEVDGGLIRRLLAKNVAYSPTLTREKSTFAYADAPAWLADPFFANRVEAAILAALKTDLREAQAKDPERQINIDGFHMAMRNLKKLADAGVRIGFGTDTGPPGRFPGYFEHWEAELMVEAGLTPMQVIRSFSKNASEALRIDRERGTLAEGKYADLIILNKNPLGNIRNLREMDAVYIGGVRVSPAGAPR